MGVAATTDTREALGLSECLAFLFGRDPLPGVMQHSIPIVCRETDRGDSSFD